MSSSSTENGSQLGSRSQQASERLVYVLPEHALEGAGDDEIRIGDLWSILWRRKWFIISVTSIFAIASLAYALLATEWYGAEALLAPAEDEPVSSLGGQLGGLAALAGVNVSSSNSIEAIATLKSRDFARDFIEDLDLLPVFFRDAWDAETGTWLGDSPEDWPDTRDAVKYFHDNVLNVGEDRQTGLVTLTIEWIDPEIAATWVNTLVRRLNGTLRAHALEEAERNVAYLRAELLQTSIVTLQQSISSLLERELQKLMLARGNEEFAFRVIDAAITPKERVRPKRTLIVVLGTMLGGILAVFAALIAHALRSEPE